MRSTLRTHFGRLVLVLVSAGVLAGLGSCGKRKRYPDLNTGWHNSDYTRIFGRLSYVPAKTEDSKPFWVLRYADINDRYNGRVVLIPETKMVGYSGGETVAVVGRLRLDLQNPTGTGTFYDVQSIHLWDDYASH